MQLLRVDSDSYNRDQERLKEQAARITELEAENARLAAQLASAKRRIKKHSTEHVPTAFRSVVAFMSDKTLVVMQDATMELGDDHNCDANGCGQDHVAYAFPLDAHARIAALEAELAKEREAVGLLIPAALACKSVAAFAQQKYGTWVVSSSVVSACDKAVASIEGNADVMKIVAPIARAAVDGGA